MPSATPNTTSTIDSAASPREFDASKAVKILPTTIAEKGITRASVRARTLDRLDLWLSVRMALSLSLRLLTGVTLQVELSYPTQSAQPETTLNVSPLTPMILATLPPIAANSGRYRRFGLINALPYRTSLVRHKFVSVPVVRIAEVNEEIMARTAAVCNTTSFRAGSLPLGEMQRSARRMRAAVVSLVPAISNFPRARYYRCKNASGGRRRIARDHVSVVPLALASFAGVPVCRRRRRLLLRRLQGPARDNFLRDVVSASGPQMTKSHQTVDNVIERPSRYRLEPRSRFRS
jgi:hypothetical protein